MSDKVDQAKLNYHAAILAVTADAIEQGSVTPKYGAQRLKHEINELCATAGIKPVAVTTSEPVAVSASLEGE